ncbi:hypothetical protein AB5I41_07550 [Sphingomonas sp. MMS24-JH45]
MPKKEYSSVSAKSIFAIASAGSAIAAPVRLEKVSMFGMRFSLVSRVQ